MGPAPTPILRRALRFLHFGQDLDGESFID